MSEEPYRQEETSPYLLGGGMLSEGRVPPSSPLARRSLEEWNRLSFYGGSTTSMASDLFATSPATASALAYFERTPDPSPRGESVAVGGGGSQQADIQFTDEDLARIKALRVKSQTGGASSPHHRHQQQNGAHEQQQQHKEAEPGGGPRGRGGLEQQEHSTSHHHHYQHASPSQHSTTHEDEPPTPPSDAADGRHADAPSPGVDSFDAEFEATASGREEEEDGVGREWALQSKHFFILSDAGKPIYSRHGDEQKLCSLMGVMQGIFSFVTSGGDDLRSMYAGDHVMVFMSRGPLYLVAIASSGEPASVLKRQLEWLHLQIISTITSGITKIFETRPCFDLRSLLRGSTKFIDNLVAGLDKQPSYLINATQCLPLEPAIRSMTGTYLQGIKSEDLVYALLIADGKLVNFVQPKRHPLKPEDLQLILNFLESSGTFRTNETWVPICLPKFNDGGYLYAYLCYLNESTCLVLISTVRNSEKFYELAEWKQKIDKSLRAAGALEAITKSVSRESYTASAVGVPGLVSFLYRHNALHQFTAPSLDPPYHTPAEQAKILRRYQKLYGKVLERPPCGTEGEGGKPPLPEHPYTLRQHWDANDRESSLVWVTSDVLLFILFEPWVARPQAVHAANDILKWVKSRDSNLFVLPAATQTW